MDAILQQIADWLKGMLIDASTLDAIRDTLEEMELERKYREAENTCIHDMVHAADLTPEELAVIIRRARAGVFDAVPAASAERKLNDEKEESENE